MSNIRKSFATTLSKAKIEDFKFHDLRHTFASQLVRNGVDLYTVQKLLGHASAKMTQRYAHFSEEHLRGAIAKLEKNSLLKSDPVYNKNSSDGTNMAHRHLWN